MIKRKDVTIINISEYIAQEKSKLINNWGTKMLDQQRFYWNKREWEILRKVCYVLEYKAYEGMCFMGTSHFKSKVK